MTSACWQEARRGGLLTSVASHSQAAAIYKRFSNRSEAEATHCGVEFIKLFFKEQQLPDTLKKKKGAAKIVLKLFLTVFFN